MERWTVLYDSDCGFCKWALAGLLGRDRDSRLAPMALQRPEAEALLADLDPETRMESWHLISPAGERRSGGAAVGPLLRLLRGCRFPAAAAERFPAATDRGYRWVAAHRSGLSRWVPGGWKRRAAERVSALEAAAEGDSADSA